MAYTMKTIEDLRAQVADLEDTAGGLHYNLDRMTDDVPDFDLTDLRGVLGDLQTAVSGLEETIDELPEGRVDDLRADLETEAGRVSELRSQLRELGEAVASLKSTYVTHKVHIPIEGGYLGVRFNETTGYFHAWMSSDKCPAQMRLCTLDNVPALGRIQPDCPPDLFREALNVAYREGENVGVLDERARWEADAKAAAEADAHEVLDEIALMVDKA